MLRPSRPTRLLLAAALVFGLHAVLSWSLQSHGGLTETFFEGIGETRIPLIERRTATIELGLLDANPRIPRRDFSVRWNGVWHVAATDIYAVTLTTNARATLLVDDEMLQEQTAERRAANPRLVSLTAGFHRIVIEYAQHDEAPAIEVLCAPSGSSPAPLPADRLLTSMPAWPRLRSMMESASTWSWWLAVAAIGMVLYAALIGARRLAPAILTRRIGRFTLRQLASAGLVTLVVVYGATLRLEAITRTYGPVDSPRWLHILQERSIGALRRLTPAGLTWSPESDYAHLNAPPTKYSSDPYTYLQYAREMRSFYAAHRRERLFPFATKVWLWLLHQQDVAVSFASASFAVIAILGTFLLGAYAFSYGVGLGAALAMSIEYDLISWSIGGWRDDAFVAAVVWFTYALLRCLREPSRYNSALAGVLGGLACLVRITSLSFVAPGFACMLLTAPGPWKTRLAHASGASVIAALLVAPFLFNCWRTFGDPFYAINVHADVYRAAEGQTISTPQTTAQYLSAKVRAHPIEMLDTTVLGFTSYPFENKWSGFNPWSPALGGWLSYAALAGLVLFAGSRNGRLLLLIAGTSMIPFALTWKTGSDFRFTEHMYPFFLIAAGVALRTLASPWHLRDAISRRPRFRRNVPWLAGLALSLLTVALVTRVFPVLAAEESLRTGESVTITAGDRDEAFLGDGWSRVVEEGSVSERLALPSQAELWIPLPASEDADITLRLDPFPRPLGEASAVPVVKALLNDRFLAMFELRWNPDRVGAYIIHVPPGLARPGLNRLALMSVNVVAPRYKLWYVRVRPLPK
jgi:hypothetical protein